MMRARAARAEDLGDILRLAALAGPGFTSLAVGEEKLTERLSKSLKSFTGPDEISPDHFYLLLLELDGEIIGLSAIKAQIGMRDPFFNFRILNVAQKSNAARKRFDMDVLVLVNDYTGASEVGSLFVTKGQRGSGAGRLISQARYMLMAAAPERFSDRVISELRGHVSDQGESPFWEAIGRKFFHMDFAQADHISAEQDNQFILDLMPKYPIYTALLSPQAQAVIGQTHPAGIGARRLLEAEGFRYDGMIDIFDGGPSMSAPRNDIRTVRDSRLLKIKASEKALESGGPLTALVSNNEVETFSCVLTSLSFTGSDINLPPSALAALGLKAGDIARVWIKR
jgi:arginine N-succinyltransferase